jgi:hypothetical protein
MKTIVKALVEQTLFLESWDGPIDEDGTVKILESLAATLQGATPVEIDLLRASLQTLARDEEAAALPDAVTIEFYRTFLYAVGIDETKPAGDTGAT